MMGQNARRSLVGQPGYGGVSEGNVGEQGPPEKPAEAPSEQAPVTRREPLSPPSVLDYRRGPPDEDDEDDARDDEPRFELPQIGVPVDKTE